MSFVAEKSMLSEEVEWTLQTHVTRTVFSKIFTSFAYARLKTQEVHPDNIREHICPELLDPSHMNANVYQSNNYMFYTEPGVI